MTYQELIHVELNIASLVVGFIALIAILALIINKTNAKTPEILAIAGSIIGAKVWRAQGIKWLMPVVVIAIVILVGRCCKDATAQVIDLILLAIMIGVILKSMAGQLLLSDNVAVSERKAVLTATLSGGELNSGATATEEEVGRKIIEEAKKYEGNPYEWAGSSLTGGIDCSHFVWMVYKILGLIPQDAGYYCTSEMWERMEDFMEEWNLLKLPSNDLENAIDGDILLYSYDGDPSNIHHVGMYIQDGGYLAEAKGKAYGITMTYAAFKEPRDYIVAIFRSKKGSESNNESTVSSASSASAPSASIDLISRLSEATGASQKVVCLDAGHGGKGISTLEDNDPDGTSQKTAQSTGTESTGGLLEKDVNLAVTLATGKLLEEAGIKVVYTRTTDTEVSNIERARIANKASADIFVRIHCEGDDNTSRRGCYCYCISSGNKWQATNYEKSHKLCETILYAFSEKTGMPVDKSFEGGIFEDDGLTASNWSNMPTALIEMGNMRNAEDEEIQKNSVDLMAQGIAEGILQYLSNK